VTEVQQSDPTELFEQKKRETSTLHALVDLNGPQSGAVWFGGWHGLSALHAMTKERTSGICGCVDYEEHVHPFSADGNIVYGGGVHGMALTPAGDLWLGDKSVLYFLPQGSLGPNADLFVPFAIPGRPDLQTLDVFPGVPDLIHGVALDAQGGI